MTEVKKKILIVDDDPDILELYKTGLEDFGFEVLVAANGQEGLDQIRVDAPDLVLLDIMLPQVHGLDVLAKIRADEATKNLKVIVLSALSEQSTIGRARELGIDDYIVKSLYSMQEIISKIKAALS